MRKLKFKLDRRSLQIIYFTFIRPLLEYADVVWDNCSQYEVNELEKIQNEAARIVTGATKLVSINSLLLEVGWESLSSRRKKYKLQLLFKMQNNLSPDYLSSLVPSFVGNSSSYPLRNATDLRTLYARSQLYYNSFLPSTIRDWNNLPIETRNLTSIASFKQKLNANIITLPKYFFEGKRIGQIHHARLRTKCSSLNYHLFKKNIVDDPLCLCGAIEDSKHFLLTCDRYRDLRQVLLDNILPFCEPTFDTLLYGNSELSGAENKLIFLSVQEFIIKSNRFKY